MVFSVAFLALLTGQAAGEIRARKEGRESTMGPMMQGSEKWKQWGENASGMTVLLRVDFFSSLAQASTGDFAGD